MATGVHAEGRLGFKEIKLLKDRVLGLGSYGVVCEAACDDLVCAAKILHQVLVPVNPGNTDTRNHRLPSNRFLSECAILRDIRHPNITQYLGMFQDPDTHSSVLVMELMDKSLTQFLKDASQPVPYFIQVNLCLDISRALAFLHSNGITHRDLSSNNILLIGNCRAKVSDFGMAKMIGSNVQGSLASNTPCPGTDNYMPPEAVFNRTMYTDKGDIFSLGVNIIQILTRQSPAPGNRLKKVKSTDPQFPTGEVEIRVSEIERRQNHIGSISSSHPLLPIACECLIDAGEGRPSASSLAQRLVDLTYLPRYTESKRNEGGVFQDMGLKSSTQAQPSKVQELLHARDREIEDMRKRLAAVEVKEAQKLEILEKKLEERDFLIEAKDLQLETKEHVVLRFQTRIEELEQAVRMGNRHTQIPSPVCKFDGELRLNWTRGKTMPCRMYRKTNACIIEGDIVYFVPGFQVPWSGKVYAFNLVSEKWSKLPDTPAEYSSLVVIGDLLTTVGGQKGGSLLKEFIGKQDHTNQLFTLTGSGGEMTWTEQYPPMPTVRSGAAAVCTGAVLIVAGGQGKGGRLLSKVEMMDIDGRHWSAVSDLPKPQYEVAMSVCGGSIYVLGGCDQLYSPVNDVFSCPLAALLASDGTTSMASRDQIWKKLPDLHVRYSTCACLDEQLVVIGGCGPDYRPTTAVCIYETTSSSWQIVSRLSTPRERCLAAALPGNKLMVAGGFTSKSADSYTDTVEMASLV